MGHSALWLQTNCDAHCQKITLKCLHKVHPHIILYNNHWGKCSWLTYSLFNPSTAHSKMKTNPWHTSISTEQQHVFPTFSRNALVLHLNLDMFKLYLLQKSFSAVISSHVHHSFTVVSTLNTSFSQGKHLEGDLSPLHTQWEKHVSLQPQRATLT